MKVGNYSFAGINAWNVKNLDQKDRKALDLIIQGVTEGKFEIKTVSEDSWTAIKNKLASETHKSPSHWLTRIFKGILNLLHLRICSFDLFNKVQEMPSIVANQALGKLNACAARYGSPFSSERNQTFKAILLKNPNLSSRIANSPDDVVENLDNPVIQVIEGLVRGFGCPATTIPLRASVFTNKLSELLVAGSVVEGLNPPRGVQVIINLDPGRINLEEQNGLEYHRFNIHDVEEEGLAQHGQTLDDVWYHLHDAFLVATQSINQGKKVLIHCMEGKNMTGVLVSMIKAHYEHLSFDDAFQAFRGLRWKAFRSNPTKIYRNIAQDLLRFFR